MINKIRLVVFNFIRKHFWDDYDPNEEFSCGYCDKEMYRRYLFCSQKCTDLFEEETSKEKYPCT